MVFVGAFLWVFFFSFFCLYWYCLISFGNVDIVWNLRSFFVTFGQLRWWILPMSPNVLVWFLNQGNVSERGCFTGVGPLWYFLVLFFTCWYFSLFTGVGPLWYFLVLCGTCVTCWYFFLLFRGRMFHWCWSSLILFCSLRYLWYFLVLFLTFFVLFRGRMFHWCWSPPWHPRRFRCLVIRALPPTQPMWVMLISIDAD